MSLWIALLVFNCFNSSFQKKDASSFLTYHQNRWKEPTCASSAISFSSLVVIEQFYSNCISSHQLNFQPTHFNEKTPSSSSFSDNPPILEIGHSTHTLTNLLILLLLLTNLFLLFPSWIFILHQHPLYSQFSLSPVSCLRDLICKRSSATITALTTQICVSAQDLSPYVQRTVSVWHLCQC